jgi:Cytidylate kinase-like family
MAFISISGEPGCRHEEVARIASEGLGWELVTEARLGAMVRSEFPVAQEIADRAWQHLARAIVAKLGVRFHLLLSSLGGEVLLDGLPGTLKVYVLGPESSRVASLMADSGLTREEAKKRLRGLDADIALLRKRRFGVSGSRPHCFDLILNAEALPAGQMAEMLLSGAKVKGLLERGCLAAELAAELAFQARLKLASHQTELGERAGPERKEFSHPSEEVFANLLDFYRIGWNYEPRSFPLQWDKDGKVLEAFTPDFYLPEFDLYVELTTMKQANVTRKNRKIRLLRAIYPHINIQVFYQKDVQDLVMKYGLPERLAR